ncbi:MAG: 9-O-acetylesterase, partial [Duncaniella sp.]|nr:9-O-acetylesterase [Duncaniella sp.]
MKKICLVSIFAGLAVMANAAVKPSSLIGDNMVLQQNCDARLWGTADPGSTISVNTSWDGKTYT